MKVEAKVKYVIPGSIAEDAFIEPGDVIELIDGKEFKDILDFKYMTSEEYYVLTVLKQNGDREEIEIYNDCFENFGVEFENPLIDKPMLCKNKCIFCFMDQLPKNVRSTMLFKDDDVRLSFLQGNYVTLTNLKEEDIERICHLKISPINVSVHVTDPERRVMMLSNPNAGNVLDIMKRFSKHGIIMNAQIVLCPGINDGEYLRKSVEDLGKLFPSIKSVSIVPVGISKHREGLFKLESCTGEKDREVIEMIEPMQREFRKNFDTSLVYLADEFYISAGYEIPPYEHYEEFPQIENGVGLIASLREEIDEELNYADEYENFAFTPKTIATSFIAYDFICECVEKIKEKLPNVKVTVEKIQNDFFGEEITVTGLLCGSDIIKQLKGKIQTDFLMLSESMFKSGSGLFLDDTTLEEVERELGVRVIKTPNTGCGFMKALVM